jgi:hypothetical protein
MRNFVLFILLIILTGEIVTLLIMYHPKPQEKVLAEATVSTLPTTMSSPTETPIPTPVPTIKPTPKPTKNPTPTPVPQPTFSSQQINEFIDRFSDQYGVDPNVIRHIALCESGFRPNAKNYIYTGLFQFGPITWKNIRAEMGEDTSVDLRANAEESVQTAAYAISKNKRGIWPNCNP